MHLYLTKRTVLTRSKVFERERYFSFAEGYFHENVLYKVFTRNISGAITDHVKFFLKFSHLKSYHKYQVHSSHHSHSNVF